MKSLSIILICLSLVGCKTLETALNPKTDKEILAERIDKWAIQKTLNLSEVFEQGFPLHSGAKGSQSPKTEWINSEELEKFKSELGRVKPEKIQSKLDEYDGSMQELRVTYDNFSRSIALMSDSQEFIDFTVMNEGSGLGEDLGIMIGTPGFISYCEQLKLAPKDCSPSAAGQIAVLNKFYSEKPSLKEYREWLVITENSIRSANERISSYGLRKESEIYLLRANESVCNNVDKFNFWSDGPELSSSIPYSGDRPDNNSIYDLAGFKVIQSTSEGVLLKPAYQDSYRSEPIFIQTNQEYVDGHIFKRWEQLVCFAGNIKSYFTVLGAQKKVYLFSAISDENQYYFLPW